MATRRPPQSRDSERSTKTLPQPVSDYLNRVDARRRERVASALHELAKAHGGQKEIFPKLDVSQGYISQLMNKSKRISETSARHLEYLLRLPWNSLDSENEEVIVPDVSHRQEPMLFAVSLRDFYALDPKAQKIVRNSISSIQEVVKSDWNAAQSLDPDHKSSTGNGP